MALTYEKVVQTVHSMGGKQFTRAELADRLGCSPQNISTHGWLEKMLEQDEIAVAKERRGPNPAIYRGRKIPDRAPSGLTYNSARAALTGRLRREPFQIGDLAEKLGCRPHNVAYHGWLDKLKEDGIIRELPRGKQNSRWYEVIPPSSNGHRPREKQPPPEVELINREAKIGGPVQRRTRKRKTTSRAMRELVERAEAQGWTVETTKKNHLRFVPPNPEADSIIAPATPSDWRSVKNTRAYLMRAGLDFEGVPA